MSPSIQWLGALPTENKWSYIAEGLRGGSEGLIAGLQAARQQALQEKQLELQRRQRELQEKEFKASLQKLNTDTKLKTVDMLVNAAKLMTPDAKKILSNNPYIKALSKDVYNDENALPTIISSVESDYDRLIRVFSELEGGFGKRKPHITPSGKLVFTEDEEKEPSITKAMIEEAEKRTPWWQKLPILSGPEEQFLLQLKRKRAEQLLNKAREAVSGGSKSNERVIGGTLFRRGEDGKWYAVED